MYKNFAAQGLGISGRQSELIELAMTYAYAGLDIDMVDMVRRVQRSDYENAARFLEAAKIKDRKLNAGGFDVPVDLDLDDDAFATALAQLHPMAETAAKLGVKVGNIVVPTATDRLPLNEFFEVINKRLGQIAQALAGQNIRLAVGFDPSGDLAEDKQFEFVQNVEGFLPLVRGAGDNIGFLIDTFSWFGGSGTLEQLEALNPEQIFAVRFCGLSEGATPGSVKSENRALPEVGGEIDFVAIAKKLKEGGYEGPVSAYGPVGSVRGGTRDNVLSKASDVLDNIFKEVGLDVMTKPMDEVQDVQVDLMDA